MEAGMRQVLKSLVDVVRDTTTFGPSILLRRFARPDAYGAVSVKTKLGALHLRPADTDMEALREVFVKRDYDFTSFPQMERVRHAYDAILADGKIPLIVDAGANIGAASLWFARNFVQARIFAVEPDPRNAELCRRNCATYEQITVVEAAIGSVSGSVSLVVEQNEGWGVRTARGADATVPVVTIADLVGRDARYQLFMVKIDIEGFEEDLFSENVGWLSEIDVLMIELHDWMLPGQYSSASFQRAITPLKFELLNRNSNLIYIR